MKVTTSNARHLLLRLDEPARLPDALLQPLREEIVVAGWMRGSGVLHDVRIRSMGGSDVRAVSGTVHAVVLEGSIGLAAGDVTCGLRAVLARETDTGLETIAGELVDARVGALEVMVTAFDEVTAIRRESAGGVWLVEPTAAASPAPAPAPVAAASGVPVPAPAPKAALPAPPSEPEPPKPAAPKPSPTFAAPGGMPLRPVRPQVEEQEEQVYPDTGDVVEHFAFGRCEVVKSDGDRLHLRLGKDGRIKEIALEMLKVTPLPSVDGAAGRHFKLDRKL